tara:strand:- start:109 stop:855 length:747 start_codon:yes stop_codon:yes gene_type:complete
MSRKSILKTQPLESSKVAVINNKLKVRLDDLYEVEALTANQQRFFNIYDKSNFIMLHGVSGTGKTYIALYKALKQVLSKDNYSRVVIVRSAVPTREIGHLPGDEREKCEVYEKPYMDICAELFTKKDAYQRLSEQHNIHFMITSFIRGITLDHSIIIVDECQNMTDMELNSIMTRVGENTKIIFCGDFRQTDLYKRYDQSGLQKFMLITDMMPSAKSVEFDHEDIVRSKLVKEYIVARSCYEDMYETK